ncbi:MAG TPA: VWA domain-containing protein [Methylovirgula sp.]|jgi:Ca-activated chloride channel family protein|nr:VWA domain-containing protein [Methylovirgula sp.]
MIHLWSAVVLRPWWLLIAAAVIVFSYLGLRNRSGLGAWTAAIEPRLLQALAARRAVIPGTGRKRFAAAAAAFLIALALAGPAIRAAVQNGFSNLDATVIVVDLSSSMASNGSLSEAQAAAAEIIQASGSGQIALIAYAGDAYVVTPFTSDRDWLQTLIFSMDGTTIPDAGTRPERALSLAAKVFKEGHIVHANVVLISGGSGIDDAAFQQAQALAASGYSLETVFTPPDAGTGNAAQSSDEISLGKLAASGNGTSANARNLGPVLAIAESIPSSRLAKTQYDLLIWRDLGPILMALALIPAVLLFRRAD